MKRKNYGEEMEEDLIWTLVDLDLDHGDWDEELLYPDGGEMVNRMTHVRWCWVTQVDPGHLRNCSCSDSGWTVTGILVTQT